MDPLLLSRDLSTKTNLPSCVHASTLLRPMFVGCSLFDGSKPSLSWVIRQIRDHLPFDVRGGRKCNRRLTNNNTHIPFERPRRYFFFDGLHQAWAKCRMQTLTILHERQTMCWQGCYGVKVSKVFPFGEHSQKENWLVVIDQFLGYFVRIFQEGKATCHGLFNSDSRPSNYLPVNVSPCKVASTTITNISRYLEKNLSHCFRREFGNKIWTLDNI